MTQHGGTCHAFARHQTSRVPIDAIWSSIQHYSLGKERHGHGSLAQTIFHLDRKHHQGAQFRLSHTRQVCPVNVDDASAPDWTGIATTDALWTETLSGTVDEVWSCWTSDVEKWLLAAGCLQQKSPERPLGSEPKAVHGQHRMADQQDVTERRLRRHIRRLQAAQWVSHHGRQPNPHLVRKLLRDAPVGPERQAISLQQWGGGLQMARNRLNALVKIKHDEAIAQWRQKISEVSGACQWVKRAEPTPWVIRDSRGDITGDRSHAVQDLEDHWTTIFGQQDWDPEPFWQLYAEDLPPRRRAPKLPPINCAQIKKVAMQLRRKAYGPDGVSAQMLLQLPQPALIRAGQMLNMFERRGTWPVGLQHWKIIFLPKKRPCSVPTLSGVRPIAVGPIMYRLWSSLRLKQLNTWVADRFDKFQAGGQGGPDVYSLLSLDIDITALRRLAGVCLDYKKAFDSADYRMGIQVLERLGAPSRITSGCFTISGVTTRD